MRSPFGVDRDAGLGQRLDIAVDRPDGDLELLRELRGRHPAAGLEEEQDIDEPRGAHRRSVLQLMTADVRIGRKVRWQHDNPTTIPAPRPPPSASRPSNRSRPSRSSWTAAAGSSSGRPRGRTRR